MSNFSKRELNRGRICENCRRDLWRDQLEAIIKELPRVKYYELYDSSGLPVAHVCRECATRSRLRKREIPVRLTKAIWAVPPEAQTIGTAYRKGR